MSISRCMYACYMSVYTDMHMYMQACRHTCTKHTETHMCTDTHTHRDTQTHTHTHTHRYTHTDTNTHTKHTHTTHTSPEVPVQYSVMSQSSLADRHTVPNALNYVMTTNNTSLL